MAKKKLAEYRANRDFAKTAEPSQDSSVVAGDIGNVSFNAFAQSTTLPIEGMSNDSYNLALKYTKYNIDARLAWVENFDQLDGSIFYTIFEHYNLGVQVQSILDSKTYQDDGFSDCLPRRT